MPGADGLDRLAYRLHAVGFPLWTFAALIAGPIWAEYAWGSYWNWDPKEVWAFITWVVYAAYLHARATAGWKGRGRAILALVGFATLLFNFVGINFFFGASLHSYAVRRAAVVGPSAELGPGGSRGRSLGSSVPVLRACGRASGGSPRRRPERPGGAAAAAGPGRRRAPPRDAAATLDRAPRAR